MKPGDVLIRDATTSRPGEFIVVDAITHQTLKGPFGSLREAVQAARQFRNDCRIWRESVDERGRVLGPAIRLDVPQEPSEGAPFAPLRR